MFIYSVTIKIRRSREAEWCKYMRQHVIDVLDTGHFMDFSFRRLSTELGDDYIKFNGDDYAKYNIEYHSQNKEEYIAYNKNGAQKLQDEHTKKFQGDFEAYRELYDDIFEEVFD